MTTPPNRSVPTISRHVLILCLALSTVGCREDFTVAYQNQNRQRLLILNTYLEKHVDERSRLPVSEDELWDYFNKRVSEADVSVVRRPVNGNSGAAESWEFKFKADGGKELDLVQTAPYRWLENRVVMQLLPRDAIRVVADDGEVLSEMKLDGMAWELKPAEKVEEADGGDAP